MILSDPQSFNRYNYCGNRPLICTDPFGLEWYYHQGNNEYEWYDDSPTDEGWNRITGGAENFVYQSKDNGWVVLDPYSSKWQDNFSSQDSALGVAETLGQFDLQQREFFGQAANRTASHDQAVGAFAVAAVLAVLAPRLLPEFLNTVLDDDENAAQSADSSSGNKDAGKMADDLYREVGKNTVSANTPNKEVHVDLKGDPHFDKATKKDIATPHTQTLPIHRGPEGQINKSRKGATITASTKADIRLARNIFRRR